MLLEDFYTINSINAAGEGKLQANVSLHANHQIYNGHFPNEPIVPGVCLVEMVRGILSGHLAKSLYFRSADQIKFMSIVDPRQTDQLIFKLSLEEEDGEYKVHNEAVSGQTTYFKMKGSFCPEQSET